MNPYQQRRFRPLGKVLFFMVLLGILCGIVATRAEKTNPGMTYLFDDVETAVTGLMLLVSLVPPYLSVKLYRKHGIKGRLIGFLGCTMLMLGIFLRQVAPDNRTVSLIVYVLSAVSILMIVYDLMAVRREIARLRSAISEKGA